MQVSTDDYSRISISATDGVETWRHNFYDYERDHSLTLLGFKPGRVYEVEVSAIDAKGNRAGLDAPITFITDALPADFPPITVLTSKPEKMEPGFTLLRPIVFPTFKGYVTMVDNAGEVVWYCGLPSNFGVTRMANGNLLYPLPNEFREVNMLGEVVRTWGLPAGMSYHHEVFPTSYGTFLFLSDGRRVVEDFPSSSTDPDAPLETATLVLNPVREMSVDSGEIINEWFPIDMLDPRRLTYMTFQLRSGQTIDWAHANAVIEDPSDGCLIVSMRHQNAVIKFTRGGELKWILGPHANWSAEFQKYLLTPVGTPFEWNYGQHAPMVTPRGTILLYDNGNFRASPFDPPVDYPDNYSRAVEYQINEETMTVSQVWEYGENTSERFVTAAIGDANYLENTGNILITFGGITYVNGQYTSPEVANYQMSRIIEVTHDAEPEVVFDLSVYNYEDQHDPRGGYWVYRSHRIPDLYPDISLAERIEFLLARVEESMSKNPRWLVVSLKASLAAIERGHSLPAIHQLRAFQFKALVQLLCVDHELATQFFYGAQGIIDEIVDGGSAKAVHKRFRMELTRRNGRPCLEFLGDNHKHYYIEASPDLIHWEELGKARHIGGGRFDFEDGSTNGSSARYYRLRESSSAE